jgi:cell division protein FtsQ
VAGLPELPEMDLTEDERSTGPVDAATDTARPGRASRPRVRVASDADRTRPTDTASGTDAASGVASRGGTAPHGATDAASGSDDDSRRATDEAGVPDVAPHVPSTTPIGARVRAAETAREARVARKRRRLLERAEVRRFTRRSRHRRAAWLAAGGVVAVLVVSVLVAVYSPLMALRTIEVKGTDRVDAAQVRAALSGQIGTPLARIDLDEVQERIAGFPLIERYVTEEEPPHTLVVTVTERTPVVAVQSGKTFDLVDPAGIVVQSSTKRPDDMPLADIGRAKLGSAVFRTMTEVVLAMPADVRKQVSGIAASTSDDVTLSMRDGSSVVWGSPDESAAKAELLAALVADHAQRSPDTEVEFDVSAPDNGIIRPRS